MEGRRSQRFFAQWLTVATLLIGFSGIGSAANTLVTGQVTPPVTYALPAQQLAGLPHGIALDEKQPLSPSVKVRRLSLLSSRPALGNGQLVFPIGSPWSFLPNALFRQVDAGGNSLLLYPGGKAEVFNKAGVLIGTQQDPLLKRAYEQLLLLTM